MDLTAFFKGMTGDWASASSVCNALTSNSSSMAGGTVSSINKFPSGWGGVLVSELNRTGFAFTQGEYFKAVSGD